MLKKEITMMEKSEEEVTQIVVISQIRKMFQSIIGKIKKEEQKMLGSIKQILSQINHPSNLQKQKDKKQISALFKQTNEKLFQAMQKQFQICFSLINDATMTPYHIKFDKQFRDAELMRVSKCGYKIRRQYIRHPGKTSYAVVNKPLSLKNRNKIKFRILQQSKRFLYVGLCNLEKFKLKNFGGKLYKMNNGMYGIRQNQSINGKAVTLHSSSKDYSDQYIVPWDFKMGDEITIEIFLNRMNEMWVLFLWNETLIFQMPLDHDSSLEYHPFVGLKYNGDEIGIVDQLDCYQNDYYTV